jgi:hypothetical protein
MRYAPPPPRTFSESYAHQASSEPSHTRSYFSFPQHHSGEAYTDSKTSVQEPSHAKGFKTRVSEFGAIVTADCSYGISVPLVPQPQDKISNKTKHLPLILKKEHPHIPRVIIHNNKDIPLPTRRSHTSWAHKVHMEQLAWTLSHHVGERRVRRGYHLGMPTRRTNPTLSQATTVAILGPN